MNPPVNFHVAPLFDHVDPERGPVFAPEHPRLRDPGERDRLLTFLRHGTALLEVSSKTEDRVDPSRGDQVPIVTQTDGRWIWNAGHTYYLQQYDLALDAEFHEHIRRQRYIAAIPGRATMRAAAEFLREYQRTR